MGKLPIIYTVRIDLSKDIEEEANRWNNSAHISDLLGAGFLSAVRFQSLQGEPKYLHLYELPDVSLLDTEIYQNVRKNDKWGAKLTHGFSNHSASLYEQILAVNVPAPSLTIPTPRTNSIGGIRSKYLATVRMDIVSESADELIKWHQEEHIPLILEADGVVSVRLCRKQGNHPRTPSYDPEWISIYELTSLNALKHAKIKEANETEWAKRMHAKISDVRFSTLERIFPV